ncbi:hypothetical protein F4779DRAFT_638434 [Xylariaceae sp. FL0662B]|nr:hypothetical protein F4779DRAFT_638434 [Xylariaceae sp. FL0662B]
MPLTVAMIPNDSDSEDSFLEQEIDDAGDFIDEVINENLASAPDPLCPHGLEICPPCGHGCQRIKISTKPGAYQWTDFVNDLEPLGEGRLYVTRQSYMFSWRSDETDTTRITTLLEHDVDKLLPLALHFNWSPRFIPQWDEQVRGIGIWNKLELVRGVRFKAPAPVPPSMIGITYCNECQLTWLKGETSKYFHIHPTHNTLRAHDASLKLLEERSLVVHIDAVKYGPGTAGEGIYGVGVYFGKDSKYNHTHTMYLVSSAHKQNAEIHAACEALRMIKKRILPDYIELLDKHRQKLAEVPEHSSFSTSAPKPVGDSKQAGEADSKKKPAGQKKTGKNKNKNKRGRAKNKGKGKGKAEKPDEDATTKATEEAAEKIANMTLGDAPEDKGDAKKPPHIPESYLVERPFDLDTGATATSQPRRLRPGDDTSNDLRLILATDSTNLVDVFCSHIKNWTYKHETETYHKPAAKKKDRATRLGKPVENSDIIHEVASRIAQLDSGQLGFGVEVVWWRVPKGDNAEAHALAKAHESQE